MVEDSGEQISYIIAAAMMLGLGSMIAFGVIKLIDILYLLVFRRPLYVHFYLKKKKLKSNRKAILVGFDFYQKLSNKHKGYFEHRVASFIEDKEFIGRDGNFVNDRARVLIAATAVMLTFGMRNYLLDNVDKIIIYPEVFYYVFK